MAPTPKKSAASGDGETVTTLSSTELRFIKAVFDNMTQKPDADWSAVATDLSLKDAKCAKERFRQMSVRHGWGVPGGAEAKSPQKASPQKVAKKPRTPRTPKKKAKKEEDDDEDVKSEEKAEVKAEDGEETETDS